MNLPAQGRLIPYHCDGPAMNMAIDQMLLESVGATGRPTLRLYGWSEPTLSLGYFQRSDERKTHPPSQPLAVVRRATGGGAIVHHHELTYSFIFPSAATVVGANDGLYQKVHGAMIRALADLAVRASIYDRPCQQQRCDRPFLCFMRRSPNDVIVNGYKALGSAQRKTRKAVLQHGSLLLRASRCAPELPGVTDLTGQAISINEVADRFSRHLQDVLHIQAVSEQLSDRERELAAKIASTRFGSENWTDRR